MIIFKLALVKMSSQKSSVKCKSKGSFNVRIGHELHLSAMIAARQQQISLNDFVSC